MLTKVLSNNAANQSTVIAFAFLSEIRSHNFQVEKIPATSCLDCSICLNYSVYPHQRKTGTKFNAFIVSTNELRSNEGPIKDSKSSEHIQKHGPGVGQSKALSVNGRFGPNHSQIIRFNIYRFSVWRFPSKTVNLPQNCIGPCPI